ncbi:MAG: hypothetical protein QM526_00850 [Alphaproteobacteria bacterium]|nr:hypothetical protein [Alphaproteobacteria bacterium]
MMTQELLESSTLLFSLQGAFGGLIRGLVGLTKHFQESRKKYFQFSKLFYTVLVSAIVGAVAGNLVIGDWRLVVIAGYAGSDFIQGLYKSKVLGLIK